MIVYCVLIIVIKHHIIFVSKQNTGIVFFYFEFFIFLASPHTFFNPFSHIILWPKFWNQILGSHLNFLELFCLAFFVNLTAILL